MSEQKQMKINVPYELARWIAIEAAKNMRSKNSEVLLALKEKMERQKNEKGEAQAS